MGISAAPTGDDPWAADPEALLLLTLEVGRDEPRLFDEVFDWLVVNERLLSVQRLRNLCVDEADRALVGATLAAAGRLRKRQRFQGERPVAREAPPQLFYRRLSPRVDEPDPAFSEFGFLKPLGEFQGRSGSPDMSAPINFAFRLRSLLGVGARAEVVRVLLGGQAPHHSVAALAASTGYAKRNVQEALAGLRAAGVVETSTIGNEQRVSVPLERWAALLEVERLPEHVDWPQMFSALRLLLRWLQDPAKEELTEYMLASEARLLLESVAPDLYFAGMRVDVAGSPGAAYWEHFANVVDSL
ncbi:MAG TPA: hypothetical protein VGV69_08320, partial [Solirubrobacterales bacterium]|nr:hypothetical protein [Solirubrobacterales bacterium]